MTPLSQRDPRWADIKLGTSDKTISTHGCTITCLAMMAGTTPDVVNNRLLAVKGYADKNLIIWTKIDEALPNLHFVFRHYVYNNEDVKGNLPCLVEVDGSRIGGKRHWVLYTGNQQMLDPWYGNLKATNYYPPVAYVIIQIKGEFMVETPYADIFTKYGFPANIPHDSLEVIFEKYHEWKQMLINHKLITEEEVKQMMAEYKTQAARDANARKLLSKIFFNNEGAAFDQVIDEAPKVVKEADELRKPAKFAKQDFDWFNSELGGTYMYPEDLETASSAFSALALGWKTQAEEYKQHKIDDQAGVIINESAAEPFDIRKWLSDLWDKISPWKGGEKK